jgi:ribosome recycling factor
MSFFFVCDFNSLSIKFVNMEDALAAIAKLEKSIELLSDDVRTLQTQFNEITGKCTSSPITVPIPTTTAEDRLERNYQYKKLMRSPLAETEGYLRFRDCMKQEAAQAEAGKGDREKTIESLTRKLHDAHDRRLSTFYASNQAVLKLNEIRAGIMRDVAYGKTDDEKLCTIIDRELDTHKASQEMYSNKERAYMALWN